VSPAAGPPTGAESTPLQPPSSTVAEESARPVAPLRGQATIGYLAPATKVEGDTVVTKIVVKNLAAGAIAGLKVEEFWWDRSGNPLGGGTDRLRQPLMPGETATLTLETPRDKRMFSNTYRFSHAYGTIKAEPMKSIR
jgi:hypothetical protein